MSISNRRSWSREFGSFRSRKHDSILVQLCLSSFVISVAQPANILLLAPPIYSQCSQIASLGKTLSQRGHHVWALVPDAEVAEKCFGNKNIEFIKYKVDEVELSGIVNPSAEKVSSFFKIVQLFSAFSQTMCSYVCKDQSALQTLSKMHFDIAIVNSALALRCYLLIPYKYNIPFVSFCTIHFWSDIGKPFHSTMENNPFTYSRHMTFLQSLGSSISNIIAPFVGLLAFKCKTCDSFTPDLTFKEYANLINQAQLYIQDDDFILFGAFSVMPNTVHVGGFLHSAPKTLPKALDEFYRSPVSVKHGVILVSFGSVLGHVSSDFEKHLTDCFAKLQQNILWKTDDKEEQSKLELTNLMVSKWTSQRDVLGHPRTVVFVSHCGRKSFYEALYHAVPLLCIPLSSDQPAVAEQVEYHGIGLKLDKEKLTSDLLKLTIEELLSNSTYKESTRRLSSIYKEVHPEEAEVVASKAIEHVIKYGGEHLRPQSVDFSLMSYLMLDIWISVALMLFMVFLLPLFFCYRCYICCSGRHHTTKQKTQ